MKTIAYSNLRSSQDGVALVVVLCLLVVTTAAVISFLAKVRLNLQTEVSIAGLEEARTVAITGGDAVLEDLLAEMRARSSASNINPRLLVPDSVESIAPWRQFGANSTLIRQSTPDSPFFPDSAAGTSTIRASSGIATTTPSSNQRFVSLARWYGEGSSTSNASRSPMNPALIPPGSTPGAPSWIYLSSSGFQDLEDGEVIGRFAFNVFDISGLIDINNMGAVRPSSSSSINELLRAGEHMKFKSLPLSADIHQSITTTSPNAGNIGRWKFSNAIYGNFTTNASLWFSNQDRWKQNGGLSGTLRTPASAIPYKFHIGRQDLLLGSEASVPAGTSPATATGLANSGVILPALTHFLRERNTPSLPGSDASILGFSSSDRFRIATHSIAGNVTVFSDNGTTRQLPVAQGEPILANRFSLGRISRIQSINSSGNATIQALFNPSGNAAAIQQIFGLRWDGDRWVYVSPDMASPALGIKNLSAISNRLPDFFETLKAGVVENSLGGYSSAAELGIHDNSDLHLTRIGANIIDQADADNIPTVIEFAGQRISGVEDLPHLMGVYFTSNSATANTTASLRIYPVLYNPHRQTGPVSSTITFAFSGNVNNSSVSTGVLSFTANHTSYKSRPSFIDGGNSTESSPANWIEIPNVTFPVSLSNATFRLSTGNITYDSLQGGLATTSNFTVTANSTDNYIRKNDPRTTRYHTITESRPASGNLTFNIAGNNTAERPQDSSTVTRVMDNNYSGAAIFSSNMTNEARPVVLQRPFQNVAELGHVFRDQPWKSLKFDHQDSADLALLDLFSAEDVVPEVIAGRPTLHSAQPATLRSIYRGSGTALLPNSTWGFQSVASNTQADNLATASANIFCATPPASIPHGIKSLLTGAPTEIAAFGTAKANRETTARALSGLSQTRTWVVLIDVIGQSGMYVNGKFFVQGEARYWIHAAIDRFSGKILEANWEGVVE